ncbi:MAG: glucuronate isomerase [Clostridia bacterium]|nr:glucuronate isomerase [Clostridia bacterium]
MNFMTEDFLLKNETAKILYHEVAEKMPIIDYHCHLSPAEIASDKRFSSITEAWLGGDHYKWRLMRLGGIDEELITGKGCERDKFRAYASVLETAIGNPLYHWSHLEMKRYFGISEPLNSENADKLFDTMNERIAEKDFSAKGLIKRSNVRVICTTDDPADDLANHKALAANPIENCKVLPTFRPDKAVLIDRPEFVDYMKTLSDAAGMPVNSADDCYKALVNRIEYFASVGGKLSDHDFGRVPSKIAGDAEANRIWEKRMNGGELTACEEDGYKGWIIVKLAAKFAELGWTMQLHVSSMRNNSTKMFGRLGKDTGYDIMSDYECAYDLSRLLDAMDKQGAMPKTVLYTLNPKDFYPMIALCGCFTDSGVKAKTQFGSAWWFIDNRDGMEKQMRDTASMNLLSAFVGMLTDSRSFLSYPRHEYFRRIFCNLVGQWVDDGEFPFDRKALDKIVSGVCFENAEKYFNF